MKIWSEKAKRHYEIIDPKERFLKYVNKTETCWLWTGGIDSDGYGIFTIRHANSKHASRYSWIFHRGKVPNGLYVLHQCDVRACVNPDHLFLGTARENTHDMIKKGRQCVGTKHPRSKLTEVQVLEIRASYTPVRGKIKELSEKYGVDGALIKRIVDRRVWKHI